MDYEITVGGRVVCVVHASSVERAKEIWCEWNQTMICTGLNPEFGADLYLIEGLV